MATLTSDQIADLVVSTLDELGRAKWTDLTTDLQEMLYLPQILKKEKVKFTGGKGIKRNLMKTTSGSAKHVGLFEEDVTNAADVLGTIRMTWAHSTANWVYDEREDEMNSGAEQIVDLVKLRRFDALIDLAKKLEETWWSSGLTSTGDVTSPAGVFYWLTPWPSGTTTPGFTGYNPYIPAFDSSNGAELTGGPAGQTAAASGGLARWRNWAGKYTNVEKKDLVRKMRRAARKTNFRAPFSMPNYDRGKDRYGLYTKIDILEKLEEMVEGQNDKLGNDIAAKDGQVLFHQRPIHWVPQLDEGFSTPGMMLGINWATIHPFFLRGEYLKESRPKNAAKQHRVKECFIDLTHNTLCHDRRRNWILSTHNSAGGTT